MMLSGDNGILNRAVQAKEATRGGEVKEMVMLAVANNAGVEHIGGTKQTKTDVITQLNNDGKLTDSEVAILEENDTIVIGGITVDFSMLWVAPPPTEGPNGKPLVNQTRFTELTEEKIIGEDKLGNQIVIPAGFKLAQGANGSGDTVKDGIVIDDGIGNQYVWIPVSNINHDGSNKIKVNSADEEGVEITLGRYTFDSNSPGNPPLTDGTYQYASTYAIPVALGAWSTAPASYKYYQELTTYRQSNGLGDTTGTNTTARGKKKADNSYNGIQGFIESVEENHGYYIARYEASYRANGKAGSIPSTSSSETLALTSSPSTRTEGDLWNFVKQGEAATACYNLYSTVDSDLMNSYAWDTAIVYIQAMGNTNYANAYNGNKPLRNTGATEDEKCKIFDMAGNEMEYTTEYGAVARDGKAWPCVDRGGCYLKSGSDRKPCSRGGLLATDNTSYISFRPVLYL